MKRTATAADQPAKTDATKPETHYHHISAPKFSGHHKTHDPAHGRVNKSPIWINFGPGIN